jgi:hypothetical protein
MVVVVALMAGTVLVEKKYISMSAKRILADAATKSSPVQFVLLKKKKTSFIHNIPEDSVF